MNFFFFFFALCEVNYDGIDIDRYHTTKRERWIDWNRHVHIHPYTHIFI